MKIINHISPRGCANGACPAILLTDANVVLIQGAKVAKDGMEGLTLPDHEEVVSIPKAVFEELLSQYRPSGAAY